MTRSVFPSVPAARPQVPGPRTGVPGPRTGVPGPRTGVPAVRPDGPGPRTGVPGPRTGVPAVRPDGPAPRPTVPAVRRESPVPYGVPAFGPVRVRGGGGGRLRRLLRGQRRALAAGFALASAVIAASGLADGQGAAAVTDAGPPGPERKAERLVAAPVRIADAATVGLLRPGDRVDVIAAEEGDGAAEVVARGVRVAEIPGGVGPGWPARPGRAREPGTMEPGSAIEPGETPGSGGLPPGDREFSFPLHEGGQGMGEGALVVLSVERDTAAALAGAGASGRLAVAVADAVAG
ncbi:hypothetical protein AB0M42_09435 [Streptomyces sp. NPDC051784]|uniref:hypothetical protein n=1 Tax=Streptomyces sp. NPDC051784 TaxID=3155805 RepID=UPI003415B37E